MGENDERNCAVGTKAPIGPRFASPNAVHAPLASIHRNCRQRLRVAPGRRILFRRLWSHAEPRLSSRVEALYFAEFIAQWRVTYTDGLGFSLLHRLVLPPYVWLVIAALRRVPPRSSSTGEFVERSPTKALHLRVLRRNRNPLPSNARVIDGLFVFR